MGILDKDTYVNDWQTVTVENKLLGIKKRDGFTSKQPTTCELVRETDADKYKCSETGFLPAGFYIDGKSVKRLADGDTVNDELHFASNLIC